MSNVNIKSYLSSLGIILALMILALVLTFVVPGGSYTRIIDANGNSIIDTSVAFQQVEGGLPFWKWLLSPILVLGSNGASTIIFVIIFLLVIGGIFEVLKKINFIQYMLDLLTSKYHNRKYLLIALISLVFMIMGSFIGSFEEVVPMVPILVLLCVSLGFDAYVGIGISLIAVCCGFAAGIMNPFTIGVAQNLAGLPMFSGIWFRVVNFILIYGLFTLFIFLYARRIEKKVDFEAKEIVRKEEYDRAIKAFVISLGIGVALIVASPFVTFLQDLTMVIVALMFLVGGTVSAFISGIKTKDFFKTFLNGIVSVLPAVVMILMASSIRYILEEANILDTIMHAFVGVAENVPTFLVILVIYFIVLIMNFFIPSGSAKAFLLIPLIIPIAQLFGISAQLCIVAFAFGDGFSNVFYPTNPVLLISLNLSEIKYKDYVKFSWKFQLPNLVLTCLILLFGFVIGY